MRISIVIESEGQDPVVIGHNQKYLVEDQGPGAPWIWSAKFNSDVIRSLTSEQAWAASFLCMSAACERLPVPPSHQSSLAAAAAYQDSERRREADAVVKGAASVERNRRPGNVVVKNNVTCDYDGHLQASDKAEDNDT